MFCLKNTFPMYMQTVNAFFFSFRFWFPNVLSSHSHTLRKSQTACTNWKIFTAHYSRNEKYKWDGEGTWRCLKQKVLKILSDACRKLVIIYVFSQPVSDVLRLCGVTNVNSTWRRRERTYWKLETTNFLKCTNISMYKIFGWLILGTFFKNSLLCIWLFSPAFV